MYVHAYVCIPAQSEAYIRNTPFTTIMVFLLHTYVAPTWFITVAVWWILCCTLLICFSVLCPDVHM